VPLKACFEPIDGSITLFCGQKITEKFPDAWIGSHTGEGVTVGFLPST
jgi:hypothetical protein